ncbi:hypothetical protein J7L87_06010, partial [bacterium]|nr:hypothetical protein [bacterium]
VKNEGDEIEGLFTIDFGRKGYLYDVLNGKHLGFKKKIEDEISPYEVKLYGLLPYKLNKIDVHLKKQIFSPGEYIEGEVELKTDSKPERHVINLQVKRPDGKKVRYLKQNLETKTGKASFRIPLALNEPKGKWMLKFQDIATGTTQSIFFLLR